MLSELSPSLSGNPFSARALAFPIVDGALLVVTHASFFPSCFVLDYGELGRGLTEIEGDFVVFGRHDGSMATKLIAKGEGGIEEQGKSGDVVSRTGEMDALTDTGVDWEGERGWWKRCDGEGIKYGRGG